MNVLLINYRDSGGGAERFTVDLHESNPNSSLIVGYSDRSAVTKLKTKDDTLFNKSIQKFTNKKSFRHLLGIHDFLHGTYGKLKKTEEYRKADIIHLNNIHGGWFDLNALTKIDAEKKVVWTLHDMWAMTGGEAHVFENTGYQTGIAKTPYIKNYPLNEPWIDLRQSNLRRKKSIYSKLKNTTFVPVSSWLENCLKSSFVFSPSMKIHTIKNGVDTEIFKVRKVKHHENTKRILFFNTPNPFKGSEIGIEILKRIENDCDIYIIGAIPRELTIYTHLAETISDRVELSVIFNDVDILLFPSMAENMPLTILEAMACGVTVVSNPVGGIPEILEDGVTGFLSRSTNKKDLYQTLQRALNGDLEKIATAATEFVLKNHSQKQMVKKYQALYADLLKQPLN